MIGHAPFSFVGSFRRFRREPSPYTRLEQAVPASIASTDVREVEYLGLLPAFRTFGECGSHPQFAHLAAPPAGYRFVAANSENRPVPKAYRQVVRRPFRALRGAAAALRLMWQSKLHGVSLRAAVGFVRSRGWASQLYLEPSRRPLFAPSVPFTFGNRPWIIEIEDVVSLFFPFLSNGSTFDVRVRDIPCYESVRCLLEADNCRAIITHVRDTANALGRLFQSEAIARKTHCVPVGVSSPRDPMAKPDDGTLNFLFTSSWSQQTDQFYNRGGLEVLAAFRELSRKYDNLRLIVRSAVPRDLPEYCQETLRQSNVVHIKDYVPTDAMHDILRSAHVCLLPAARIHVVSVLQAMSYGVVPVVSDGWGMRELVDDRQSGLVVAGRYGRVSWTDPISGMLREDYRPMRRIDPCVVDRLVAAASEVIEDGALRRSLSESAAKYIAREHSLESMNDRLKSIFDRVID